MGPSAWRTFGGESSLILDWDLLKFVFGSPYQIGGRSGVPEAPKGTGAAVYGGALGAAGRRSTWAVRRSAYTYARLYVYSIWTVYASRYICELET